MSEVNSDNKPRERSPPKCWANASEGSKCGAPDCASGTEFDVAHGRRWRSTSPLLWSHKILQSLQHEPQLGGLVEVALECLDVVAHLNLLSLELF